MLLGSRIASKVTCFHYLRIRSLIICLRCDSELSGTASCKHSQRGKGTGVLLTRFNDQDRVVCYANNQVLNLVTHPNQCSSFNVRNLQIDPTQKKIARLILCVEFKFYELLQASSGSTSMNQNFKGNSLQSMGRLMFIFFRKRRIILDHLLNR